MSTKDVSYWASTLMLDEEFFRYMKACNLAGEAPWTNKDPYKAICRAARQRLGSSWPKITVPQYWEVSQICYEKAPRLERLERPTQTMITHITDPVNYDDTPVRHLGNIPQSQEQDTMNSITIVENKTFVLGREASTVTDDEIFAAIRKIENEVSNLKLIRNKPQKLKAVIAEKKAAVQALVDFVDGR